MTKPSAPIKQHAKAKPKAEPSSPWQLLPPLSPEEIATLKEDIAAHGVRVPVIIDAERGAVLDGHHRVRAWEELRAEGTKVPDYPRQVVRLGDDAQRTELVLAANLFRRHLTKAQRSQLVQTLREAGWSLRRIGAAMKVSHEVVRTDLAGVKKLTPEAGEPAHVVGQDRKSYPAKRPPALFVTNRRDTERARAALASLPEGTAPTSLLRAEERAREAGYKDRRQTADIAARLEGPSYELRVGDLAGVWEDVAPGSIDAIVTDPPYNDEGVPLYEELGRLAARVLKPGRLAAVYCGHMHLDEELRLLQGGGLTYVWHGVNLLSGRHTKVRTRMVNGRHRSVVLMSAGPYQPRKWVHDTFIAQGRGGPDTRPLHPWQQAVEPVVHWVHMVSEPGELVMDPFLGSGTTGVAALRSGRRFVGGDLDAGYVATAQERLEAEVATLAENGGEAVSGDEGGP